MTRDRARHMALPIRSITSARSWTAARRQSSRALAAVVVATLLALWVLRIALGLLGQVESPA